MKSQLANLTRQSKLADFDVELPVSEDIDTRACPQDVEYTVAVAESSAAGPAGESFMGLVTSTAMIPYHKASGC